VRGNNFERREEGIEIRLKNDDISTESAAWEPAVTNRFFHGTAANPTVRRSLHNIESAPGEIRSDNSGCWVGLSGLLACHCVSLPFCSRQRVKNCIDLCTWLY